MKTTLVNVREEDCDVFVSRPGKWGNPFVKGRDGDRAAVCAMHARWLAKQPGLLCEAAELKGKRIGCYCAPLECHGELLADLADIM